MSRTQRLTLVLGLNLGLVAGLVAVGLTAHSLAVLAEGGDYLLDAAGAAVAVLAIRMSARGAGRNGRTGRPGPTDLAALVNCGWLLLLEVLVAAAAAARLATRTPEVHGLPVLVMSGVAALAMTIGALVLRADADTDTDTDDDDDDSGTGGRDLSVAAVLLDTIADAAAAAGVAATGAIILAAGGWYWLDPAVALVIAVVVGYHAAVLLRKVLRRLRLPGSGQLTSARIPAATPCGAGPACTVAWKWQPAMLATISAVSRKAAISLGLMMSLTGFLLCLHPPGCAPPSASLRERSLREALSEQRLRARPRGQAG